MYYFYSLVIVLVIASVHAQLDCPNPAVDCVADPCDGARCPRFYNADCEVNLCHGLCTANFIWRGRNVTDRCPVPRCADIDCPGKRVCMEELTPSSCSGDRPKCRQYINARCVLPPLITDCNDLECPEGLVCRKRFRSEEVVCVVPRDCSQLECREGFTCVVEDRIAQCLPQLSCEGFECPPNEGCFIRTSSMTPTCNGITPTCETLNCDDQSVCFRRGFPSVDVFASLCADPLNVREFIPCDVRNFCDSFTEVCVDSRLQNGDFVRSYCIDSDCYTSTNSDSGSDSGSSSGSGSGESGSTIPECLPDELDFVFGLNCVTSERNCPFLYRCANVEIEGQVIGTICTENDPIIASCEERDCPGESGAGSGFFATDVCVQDSIDGINTLAECVTERDAASLIAVIRSFFS